MTYKCTRHNPKSYILLSQMDNDQLRNYSKIHISTDSQDLIKVLAERLPKAEKTNYFRDYNFPIIGYESICNHCLENGQFANECEMNYRLDRWNEFKTEYSPDEVPESIFEEHSIDSPTIENNIVTWCPMYSDSNP